MIITEIGLRLASFAIIFAQVREPDAELLLVNGRLTSNKSLSNRKIGADERVRQGSERRTSTSCFVTTRHVLVSYVVTRQHTERKRVFHRNMTAPSRHQTAPSPSIASRGTKRMEV